MKRTLIGSIVALALLAIPSMANAHSGIVSCDANGVKFTYNHFSTAKTATEYVNDSVYTFNVTPNVVNTHIVPLPTLSPAVVSATWGGPGSIAPRTLTCPVAPPVAQPLPCPYGTVFKESANGYMVCILTVTRTEVVAGPPAATPLPATIPPVYYKCPKGTTLIAYKSGATICLKKKIKNKIKTVTKIKIVYVDVPDDKPTPPKGGGVAG